MLTIWTLTLICHYFYANNTLFANTAHDSNNNSVRDFLTNSYVLNHAFSALTLLVGHQEEYSSCKNEWQDVGVVICLEWGADCFHMASAMPKRNYLSPHLNPDWFYPSGTGLPRLSWKRGRQTGAVVIVVVVVPMTWTTIAPTSKWIN